MTPILGERAILGGDPHSRSSEANMGNRPSYTVRLHSVTYRHLKIRCGLGARAPISRLPGGGGGGGGGARLFWEGGGRSFKNKFGGVFGGGGRVWGG
eukprot:COSAG02_NODE_479_length_21477_cov_49.737674_16_plen_96_part_01